MTNQIIFETGPVFGAAWNFPISDARPMDQVNYYAYKIFIFQCKKI